jgi:hypothetical protein
MFQYSLVTKQIITKIYSLCYFLLIVGYFIFELAGDK